MANPITNVPTKLPETYTESQPIINDNFDKIISNVNDLTPRTFSTASTGARPGAGKQLAVITLAYDRPEYTNFATLTPQYDIYVDSGTNATGTVSIDNTAGIAVVNVAIGDYFAITSEIISQPEKPHYFIATAATSVGIGASGSVAVVAERCGTEYNMSGVDMNFTNGLGQDASFGYYTVGQSESQNISTIMRAVSITPNFGGSGGGGGAVYTLNTTGGAGVENDSAHLWPNGTDLTSAQKAIVVQHHLNLTTTTTGGGGNDFIQSTTAPYTKNFATATIRCINHDSAAHSIYVYVTGTIFSGITGNIFK